MCFVTFLDDLRHEFVVLRGDAEHSLMALLAAVANRVNGRGVVRVSLETAPIGSHQSIGAAEHAHGVLGDQVRALVKHVMDRTGFDIHPATMLFAWLLKHAVYLLNRFHVTSTGVTPIYAATGVEPREPLAVFGEVVHAKIPAALASKTAMRWHKGIWAGIHRPSSANVVLTAAGPLITRDVKRLAEPAQWSKELLQEVRGLPWSPKEGVEKTQKALKNEPVLEAIAEGEVSDVMPTAAPLPLPDLGAAVPLPPAGGPPAAATPGSEASSPSSGSSAGASRSPRRPAQPAGEQPQAMQSSPVVPKSLGMDLEKTEHSPPSVGSADVEAKRSRGTDHVMLLEACDIDAIEDAAVAFMPESRRK